MLAKLRLSEQVSVSGDTRFDRVIEIAENAAPLPVIEAFCGNRPVVVAGSTWEEDEEELDHFANENHHIKLIIAPHEIDEDRLKEVESLFENSARFSDYTSKNERSGANVLIIDNIGMLSRLYRYATITYVGGGFHDVLLMRRCGCSAAASA